MKAQPDYSLYLVTDRTLARGRSVSDIVAAAVAGGVTCVQFRDKEGSTRDMIAAARELVVRLRPLGVPLIVNDRLDVALAAGADGIHVGQTDMELNDVKKWAPPDWIIGVSAESVDDAVAAAEGGADYIGISPVFSTPTKTDTAAPLGLDGVAAIRAAVSCPLVGIGGINAENAAAILAAGADGVAVVSAIMAVENPQPAAAALKQIVNNARRESP